ncbi:hypothetical protein GFS31_28320 [Leptolyngbya sp. BL0902]|uniref:hypothetical protein n=1 Tax=Leptolyngbya sp. BL0902 TaxID=1115757 RepID=UPI0018E73300|nr:hypothetical protein [Leptolyngbya sp. BL0902]QQE66134.1 hypothetical protein GFS31_28320 [Leptolyngbya sp. BL0902]
MSNGFGLSITTALRLPLRVVQGRLGTITLGMLMVVGGGEVAQAQVAFPVCPPPQTNEYLLLVRGNTEAERNRVQDLLPSSSTVMVCNYLSDTVVRAGGFTSLENANAWAQYMTEVEGLQAFVARPATATTPPPTTTTPPPTATTPPPPTATTPPPTTTAPPSTPENPTIPDPTPTVAPPPAGPVTPIAYAPQPLNAGFAVLVDYQYQPETARSIQRQVGQAVGLAVYRQRPYLLIAYSPNLEGAATTLQVLGGYGISGFIVDSQEVVMLTPAIALVD